MIAGQIRAVCRRWRHGKDKNCTSRRGRQPSRHTKHYYFPPGFQRTDAKHRRPANQLRSASTQFFQSYLVKDSPLKLLGQDCIELLPGPLPSSIYCYATGMTTITHEGDDNTTMADNHRRVKGAIVDQVQHLT